MSMMKCGEKRRGTRAMKNIPLPDELAQQLEALAEQQKVSVVELVAEMVEQLQAQQAPHERGPKWENLIGISDADIPDMSMSVRETLRAYYRDKYGRPD
jgi:hypothetical protein